MKNILLLLLINSLFSFAQKKEEVIQNKKRNAIGIDLSVGPSLYNKREPRVGFSGALNYSKISKAGNRIFEFGVRYTQLNFITNKKFSHYNPKSDTYTIGKWNILFFDIPFNIKKIFPINEKINIMINFGAFYSTHIKWLTNYKEYLTEDDSFISEERGVIKPMNHDHIGFDTGAGISRYISSSLMLNITAHINVRAELDGTGGRLYAYPNLTFGIRYLF